MGATRPQRSPTRSPPGATRNASRHDERERFNAPEPGDTKGALSRLIVDSVFRDGVILSGAKEIRAMPAAVVLRTDHSAAELRRLARASKDTSQSRRLLSLAAVLDGMDRGDAARVGPSLQRTRPRRSARPPWRRRRAAPVAGAEGRVRRPRRGRPRPREGRRRALAKGRFEAGRQGALRRRLPRALRRGSPARDGLLPRQRAAPASRAEAGDRRGFQKRMARPFARGLSS